MRNSILYLKKCSLPTHSVQHTTLHNMIESFIENIVECTNAIKFDL